MTWAEAAAACAAADLHLCTPAEWAAACEQEAGNDYPYGPLYEPDLCNGLDAGEGAVLATGALATCATPDAGGAVYDLSGNVKEWVDDGSGTGYRQVRGGSYQSPAPGLECGFDFAVHEADTLLPTLGFRCCGG